MNPTAHLPAALNDYAVRTLSAVRDLTIEEQMDEISMRVTVGEYAGVPDRELNVLRHAWQALFNRLYRFTTVH
ncbi:hypothetical protein SAMN05428967_4444 [Phyllobacterium sp. YR620]|uniref:hypothetical protein n=1 Tax=Phyllobacterium sp. YR620 TaxID=1881066 RepID=UPI00088660F4|nr:hypothetical protein [Phyllobacterium sp. YR620]SDP92317.1 hypothetical protein SAMN05428967_4444 [Phyllobacterium sp. YR620]